jgi:hypothetical protein
MYCTNCGRKYDGTVCPTCGTPAGYKSAAKKAVHTVAEEKPPFIAETNPDSEIVAALIKESVSLQKKRSIRRIIRILLVSLLLLAAAFAVMYAVKNIDSAQRLVLLFMFDSKSPVPAGYKVYTNDDGGVIICGTVEDSLYLALVSLYATDESIASSWKETVRQAVDLSTVAAEYAESKNYSDVIEVCIKPYSKSDDYILIVRDGRVIYNIAEKVR